MEAVHRGGWASGFAAPDDHGVRMLTTVFERSVRDLPRDPVQDVQAAGPQDGRRKALAVSPAHSPDTVSGAAPWWAGARRISAGAHGADRGAHWQKRGDGKVAARRQGGARMGQTVRGSLEEQLYG